METGVFKLRAIAPKSLHLAVLSDVTSGASFITAQQVLVKQRSIFLLPMDPETSASSASLSRDHSPRGFLPSEQIYAHGRASRQTPEEGALGSFGNTISGQ